MLKKFASYLPLVFMLSAMIYIYISGIYHELNFTYIQQKHEQWRQYIHLHPFLSALIFITIHTVSVCLIVPDSIILTLIAGFVFPLPLAIFYVAFSETLGATLFVFAIQGAFKKQRKKLAKFEKKIRAEEIYYLLFLRFSHLSPFWVVNIACALMNVKRSTFIWTTFVGVLPLSFLVAQAGAGLSHYFDYHPSFSMVDFFTPEIKLSLIGLGLLALLPLSFPYLKRKLQ